MPHDSKGSKLKVGDVVTLKAKVASISLNEEACNVTLDVQGPESEYLPSVTCNSKICTKEGEGDVAKAARAGFESSPHQTINESKGK